MKELKLKRIPKGVLRLDRRVRDGYYSDKYFVRAVDVVTKEKLKDRARMQIFQRHDNVCLCGVAEAVAMIEDALRLSPLPHDVIIRTLPDGSIVNAWETVMMIEGPYHYFGQLETPLLGALKRGTMVATNVYRCFKAANGKPLFFFPARFDTHLAQAKDGYSYSVGRKAAGGSRGGVSTDAQGAWWGESGMGTMPHALIAVFGGDTVRATLAFAKHTPKGYVGADNEVHTIKRISLVDFDNDCVGTTLAVARAMLAEYKRTGDSRYILDGVRLDTSGNLVDRSIREDMELHEYLGSSKPTGVNLRLVHNVSTALEKKELSYKADSIEQRFYHRIGIIVSGGFNDKKIAEFEKQGAKVAAYAVGSSLFKGSFDFTADVVQVDHGNGWRNCAKRGRRYSENPRLIKV